MKENTHSQTSVDTSLATAEQREKTMPTAILVDGVWWRYPTYDTTPNAWTLKDVTFHIEQGECVGLTGPSGAGKTTLCRTLLGIVPATARLTVEQLPQHYRGTVTVLGKQVTARSAQTNEIGMVFQDPENQFLRMSLFHEVALGLQQQGLSQEAIVQRIQEALSWVGLERLWAGAAYRHPNELSGGQKQRVVIAAFLALRPQVLVLDEPTSDLDPVGKREVVEVIARLRHEHHMTVLLVEQDPEMLAAFCDRIVLLHEGRVKLIAPPATFYARRSVLEQGGASVGELARISWQTGYTYEGRPPLTLHEAEVAFEPVIASHYSYDTHTTHTTHTAPQRDEPEVTPSSPSPSSKQDAAIVAEQVWYRYDDGTTALRGINLDVQRGEMLALLGPNGSGKTTFAKILAGMYRSWRGTIQVLGQDIASKQVRMRLPTQVGYVFQNPDHQLFSRSVRAELEYGLRNLRIPAGRRQEVIAETLEAVHLTEVVNEDPLFLSKGQRQRLAVAAILAMKPEILIVDEPTTGQDARSVTAIMQVLCALQQQGKTVVIITHDMTLVAEYCQRVVAFRDGEVAFTGTPQHLFADTDLLKKTGLHAPSAVQLAEHFRTHYPHLPPLLTVEEWSALLGNAPTM